MKYITKFYLFRPAYCYFFKQHTIIKINTIVKKTETPSITPPAIVNGKGPLIKPKQKKEQQEDKNKV